MRTSYRRLKKVFCVLSLVVMVCLLTFFCATLNYSTASATTVDEIENSTGVEQSPDDFSLNIPAGELFDNTLLEVCITDGEYGVSRRVSFGSEPIPLWHKAKLSLKVDSLVVDSSKLYVKRITKKGGYSVGGKYSGGRVCADVTALGTFEVAVDTVPPRLLPIRENRWMHNGKVVLAMSDKETSVRSFRGTIDGKFVLFKYSSKNGRLELDLKGEGVSRGVHQLRVEAVDACGNIRVYEKKIKY